MAFFDLSPDEISAILLSLKVAGTAVLFALPLALIIGFILARCRFFGHALLSALMLLPLVLPPVVTGYLLLVSFGANGFAGKFLQETLEFSFAFRWTGAALAAGIMAFPLMVRPVRQAFEMVDKRLEESASSLGAGRLMVFVTITLPLALPGILAGFILGFAKALGEFGATITFVSNIPDETTTLPLAIHNFTQVPDGELGIWRLTIVAAVIALIAVLLSEYLHRRLAKQLGRDDE